MDRRELLGKWNRMIVRVQIEHEISARDFEKFSWKLGIPCVVLSAVVSASVFSTIKATDLVWLQWTAGVISILTLVLSSVQTFLNFDVRAAAHRATAGKLGAIAREVQDEIASDKDEAGLAPVVSDIRKRLDAILVDAPTLPKSTIRKLGDSRLAGGQPDPQDAQPV